MPEIKLIPNVPVTMDVKYCDVMRGNYRARLRFKGKTASEAEAVLYCDASPNLQDLVRHGACQPVDYDPDSIPVKGVEVKLSQRKLTFVLQQLAGEKKPTLVIRVGDGTTKQAPTAAATAEPRRAASSTTATTGETRTVLYKRITDFVLRDVVPKYQAAGIECRAGDIAQMVETLYNRETRAA